MQHFHQNTAALQFPEQKREGKSDNIADLKQVTLDKVDKTGLKSESLLSFHVPLLCARSMQHSFGYFCYVICKVTCKLSVFIDARMQTCLENLLQWELKHP